MEKKNPLFFLGLLMCSIMIEVSTHKPFSVLLTIVLSSYHTLYQISKMMVLHLEITIKLQVEISLLLELLLLVSRE